MQTIKKKCTFFIYTPNYNNKKAPNIIKELIQILTCAIGWDI